MTRVDSATGVARLVLIAASVVGFLAMHGLDITTTTGSHHSAMLAEIEVGVEELGLMHTDIGNGSPMPFLAASDPDGPPAPHDAAMAGCVFVLLALAGGLALRQLRIGVQPAELLVPVLRARDRVRTRAPPFPVFVSLCVFRL